MSKHWFQAHLMSKFTKGKTLGVDLGYGLGNWDEFKKCRFVTLDRVNMAKMFDKVNVENPDIISDFNYDLPFRDDIFDVAMCYGVLHLVKNYQSFLKEIKRVLKKNGYLICVIPHENWNQPILNQVVKEAGFKSVIHKYVKEWFYATWYDKTSVYSYAILQNKK